MIDILSQFGQGVRMRLGFVYSPSILFPWFGHGIWNTQFKHISIEFSTPSSQPQIALGTVTVLILTNTCSAVC